MTTSAHGDDVAEFELHVGSGSSRRRDECRRRRRRRVPQTMLSPSPTCPTRCCRRRRAVPHTMLSPSSARAPHDVVAVGRCPRRCCRSRRRRSRCPTRCCRRRSRCPRRCCRRRRRVPHTMLSPSLAVPQTMLSPSLEPCPTRCCRRRSRASSPRPTRRRVRHAFAVGLSTPPLEHVVAPDDVLAPASSAPASSSPAARSRRTAPGARRRACSGSRRPGAAGCSPDTSCAVYCEDRLDQVRRQVRIRLQHQRDRAADDRRRHARAAQAQIRQSDTGSTPCRRSSDAAQQVD